jgi:hypothetical protein
MPFCFFFFYFWNRITSVQEIIPLLSYTPGLQRRPFTFLALSVSVDQDGRVCTWQKPRRNQINQPFSSFDWMTVSDWSVALRNSFALALIDSWDIKRAQFQVRHYWFSAGWVPPVLYTVHFTCLSFGRYSSFWRMIMS